MIYKFKVRVPSSADPENGHQTIEWLESQGYESFKDFIIDMHGGQKDHVTFFFRDKDLALMTKLTKG